MFVIVHLKDDVFRINNETGATSVLRGDQWVAVAEPAGTEDKK